MATVVERTLLVWDPEALATIDAACVHAAITCGWSGLSYYTLKAAVDLWIERYDPAAVRRTRATMQSRCFTIGGTDDTSGTTTVWGRLSAPGAALLKARLQRMAKAVCANDPRTLDQRIADALEALGADADHLKCLCGSATCAAAVDDGVGAKFVIHLYGEASLLDAQPDPQIHGDGPVDDQPHTPPATDQTDDDDAEAEAGAEAEVTNDRAGVDEAVADAETDAEEADAGESDAGESGADGVDETHADSGDAGAPAVESEVSADDTLAGPGDTFGPAAQCPGPATTTAHEAQADQEPTPTGHTYTSIPTSTLYFPHATTTTAPIQRGSPRKPPAEDKNITMPKRKRTKVKDRAYRIAAERARNEVYLALRRETPGL